MKKFFFLLLSLTLCFSFSSCSSDDDIDDSRKLLIGTWIGNNPTEWYEWTFDSKTVECTTCADDGFRYEWCKGDNKYNYSWDPDTQTGSFSFSYEVKNERPATTTYTFEYINGVLYCEQIKGGNSNTYKFEMNKK